MLPAPWQDVVARVGRYLQLGGGADNARISRSVQPIVNLNLDGTFFSSAIFRADSITGEDVQTNPVATTILASVVLLPGIWDWMAYYSATSEVPTEWAYLTFSEFPNTHFVKSFAGQISVMFTGTLENSVRDLGASLEFTQGLTSTGTVFSHIHAVRREDLSS